MFIQTESTPNPATLKFCPDRPFWRPEQPIFRPRMTLIIRHWRSGFFR